MANEVTYQYLGVFCRGKFIPLFEGITSVTKGIPESGLKAPLFISDCPICYQEHTVQPGELVQWSGKQRLEIFRPHQQSPTE